jgi:hypothetical protein
MENNIRSINLQKNKDKNNLNSLFMLIIYIFIFYIFYNKIIKY